MIKIKNLLTDIDTFLSTIKHVYLWIEYTKQRNVSVSRLDK